jgi:hypothetical protein
MKAVPRLVLAVFVVQAVFTLGLYLIIPEAANASNKTASLVFGALFALVNFILLVFMWKKIFDPSKKKVALILLLIVIKYGILIGIFVSSSKIAWLDSMWFAIGIITNPASVIISGLNHKLLMRNHSKEN